MSLDDLKTALKKEKLVFGSNQAIKNIKNEKTKVVFLASNCEKEIEENIKHYTNQTNIKVITINKQKSEISVFCKKNYPVSVISY
jgi:ribosomal protein L30E|tara:strand:+ start:211 stop:465 length:255 start_codon:yes stop_codon:yes gene_type:complete